MSANGASSNDAPPPPPPNNLSDSTATFPSDSENYSPSEPSAVNGTSPSPPSTSSSPIILYSPPTIWSLLRGAAINLILPFVNGLMLGFGELLAHEAAFRFGWSGTKIFPAYRSRTMGPGVEIRENRTEARRRGDDDLLDTASLE